MFLTKNLAGARIFLVLGNDLDIPGIPSCFLNKGAGLVAGMGGVVGLQDQVMPFAIGGGHLRGPSFCPVDTAPLQMGDDLQIENRTTRRGEVGHGADPNAEKASPALGWAESMAW